MSKKTSTDKNLRRTQCRSTTKRNREAEVIEPTEIQHVLMIKDNRI